MGSKSHSGLPRIFHILNSETFLKDMDHTNSRTISPLSAWKGLPKKTLDFLFFCFQLDEFLRIQPWFHGLKKNIGHLVMDWLHRNFGTNFASTTPLILQHFTIRFGQGKGYIQEMRLLTTFFLAISGLKWWNPGIKSSCSTIWSIFFKNGLFTWKVCRLLLSS